MTVGGLRGAAMAREFRVGDWLVEPDLNRITQAEKIIQVEPKVLEVLVCLANHPGEVLPKDKIIPAVWSDTYVTDEVLTYSISELRKAFGDDARNPHIIQTIPRKGYRLIAPVVQLAPAAKPQPSIAVLAFSDMSPEKDQEYFCDGIAEEIINNLAHLKGLRIASRTSSFAFKGKSEDVRTIGRKLGVATVLEGSIRKAGNRLRITVQLIGVEDGYHLWSERYDRELKDVFAIQDEISRSVAAALRITLSPKESDAIARIPTDRPSGLRLLPPRRAVLLSVQEKKHRIRPADVFPGNRTRSRLCARLGRRRRLLLLVVHVCRQPRSPS